MLGPTALFDASGRERAVLARQDLRVLTSLVALAHGELVDVGVIEDAAWSPRPSARALGSSIYRLRAVLGGESIVTRRGMVGLSELVRSDLVEFAAAFDQRAVSEALSLVRGHPFESMGNQPEWQRLRRRWEDQIDAVRDIRVQQLIDQGSLAEASDVLHEQLTNRPSVGDRWVRLIDVLAGLGRRVDALRAAGQARQALTDAGLEPDPGLLEREQMLLKGSSIEVGASPAKVPRVSGAEHFWKRSATVLGRDAEVRDIVAAVSTGLDPVIALVGKPGMGTLRVARAAVGVLAQQDWRVIVPGNGADLTDAWELGAEAEPTKRRLVAVDWAHHDLAQLRRLAQQAVSPGTRRVLLRCVASSVTDRRLPEHLDEALGTPVHVIKVGPMGAAALLQMAPAAAESLGVDRLQGVTGGLPALAREAESLALTDRPPTLVEVTVVEKRLATLSAESATLVGALALRGGRGSRQVLAGLMGLDQAALHPLIHELGEQGWLTEVTAETVAIDAQLAAVVVAATDPAVVADLALGIRRDLGDTVVDLQVRASIAQLTGGHDAWQEAVDCAIALSAAEVEGIQDDLVECIENMLVEIEARQKPPANVPVLQSQLGLALRSQGRIAEAQRVTGLAYRASLQASSTELFRVISNAVFPAAVSATDDGEPSRAMVRAFLRRNDLPVEIELQAQAIAAFHELARGEYGVGASMARDVVQRASDVADQALMAEVCGHVIPDFAFERGLAHAAEVTYQFQLWRGHLAMASRALVYLLCSRLRRGEATFADPLLGELMLLVDQASVRSAEVRATGILGAAFLLGIRTDWPFDPSSIRPVNNLPVLVAVTRLFANLRTTPDWTTMSPVLLIGDPASWRISAPVDEALWRAAQAAEAGDAHRAVAAFNQAMTGPDGRDRDLTTAQQSPIVVTRLPLACQIVNRLGDRDLASRLLRAHVQLRGTDLSMLPVVHLGPAASWLASIAELAGDPLAASLHEEAGARLTALGARVLENR